MHVNHFVTYIHIFTVRVMYYIYALYKKSGKCGWQKFTKKHDGFRLYEIMKILILYNKI